MPRATSPAADAATPETTPPEQTDTSTVDVSDELASPDPAWGFWRYVGDIERVYPHVPVTVVHGDVIHHPGAPAEDGNWEPTDDEPTRRADNHPDTIAARHAAIEAVLNAAKEG